jgi:fumarylacetoacetase
MQPTLNTFMGMGKGAWDKVREIVAELLNSETATLRDNADLCARALVPMAGVGAPFGV